MFRFRVPCKHCQRTGICMAGDDQVSSCHLCLLDSQRFSLVDKIYRLLGMRHPEPSLPTSPGEPKRVRCCMCLGRGGL